MEKLSELMKQQITAAQERVKGAQAEIGRLMSSQQARHPTTQAQINELRRNVASAQANANDLQRKLPMQEAVEAAHDRMVAQMTEKERQQAAADRQAHDQAVRAAALAEWLKVPGQSAAGFEAAWGQIASQIATQRAVAAGAVESGTDHLAPMRQAVADALAARYGGKTL